jgi:hypothetical protein
MLDFPQRRVPALQTPVDRPDDLAGITDVPTANSAFGVSHVIRALVPRDIDSYRPSLAARRSKGDGA